MNMDHVKVADIDGLHDDGWCSQLLRARVVAEKACGNIKANIWIPAQPGHTHPSVLTFTIEGGEPALFNIPYDTPTELSVPAERRVGDEIVFRVFCSNRLVNTGDELRQLSFVLLGLAVA